LLLGLVAWAEELGLDVLCAGKAAEHDLIVDPASQTATHGNVHLSLGEADICALQPLSPGQTQQIAGARRGIIDDPSHGAGFLAEMAIVQDELFL
jgi:hypothetical protein